MHVTLIVAVPVVLLSGAVAACGGATKSSSAGGCESAKKPAPRSETRAPPPGVLDPSRTYSLHFRTNCGTFVVRLDPKLAPNTTASLVALASHGYFDDTIFHRIVPGFVIQGGDPTETGTGGPGYSTVDVPPANARYTKGVVAMAKTQAEPRGTAGSQFFVVTAGDAGLPPEYAIVGRVSYGMDAVERIGELGDQSGKPTETVVIRKATLVQS